ncbi:Sec7 guanine nucleotide exchange factor [Ceratobasidium sp. AG-Ba]|nr:Sec7 guanine nucleotide exchange factor [Ceratobasidium sp. AG-Ba]
MAFSSEATDAPPPYATPGPAGPWMLAKTTTTTKVTTTTTETHFFPLFRRKPNTRQEESAAASLRRSIDREKALPLPPADSGANSHALGIGLPVAHKSTDRDITPRAADRDITPTAPVPIIVPASPRASRIAPPRDIRRVRSSGTIRDSHINPTRRSEQNMRDVFLASKPLPVPLSAPPQHTSLPDLQPPRTRQPAISSPSLNSPGPSSARVPGPSAVLGAGFNQIGAGLGARPTTLWVGDGSGTSTWGTGVPQGWNPAQGWEREQGRLGWETNQAEFGVRMGQTQAYHSLGSRERERDRERERERRPSAPSLHVQSLKGKGKERERDSLDPDPSKEGGKRGLLSRRPSFWRKNKPKDYTDRRPSTSQQDGAVPQKSSSDATRQDATVDLNRGADPKRSHERVALGQPFSQVRRSTDVQSTRRSTNVDGPPPSRSAITSPRSSTDQPQDLSLPTVRPMTPLFSEFGVYRASVDFVAAGGPGMMAALAERLAAEGGVGVGETIPEGVEAKNESSAPIPVPGTATPPRRRLTGTSSLGRATSWRRSLVESAENWRRSIGNGGEPAAPEDVLSGSPASNSPIPWVSSSPRGSPVPRRSMQEPAPASGRESPARRQGSPARNLMSPVGGARVTFGDDSGRSRLASLVTKAKGEKNEGQSGSTAAGSGNASLRRARSTSRLTAALSPSRSRSFSLFGPRPSSAGQPQTQQSRQREEQARATGVSTLGHTHASTFSPVTGQDPLSTHDGHKQRSSTNPPLLRRLSGVFGSAGGAGRNEGLSPGGLGFTPVPTRPGSSKGAPVPKRVEDETPEVYLNRLLEGVSKTEIAGALASKSDEFHVAALQLYLSRFNFVFDPLDIALRRLLMDLSLPKETQQIDRVMEAFAKRYNECNPGLFVSEDHAYILAFSLMMLHTDAFNKSNKNKMTKADYVKNRMGGIPPEVLDCYFDNIVFAPFIFIEDLQMLTAKEQTQDRPYYIITQWPYLDLLDPLRVAVDQYIPTASPFSFTGTADCLNAAQLRHAFASNTQLEIAGIGVAAEPVADGVDWSLLFFREASWAALAPGSTGANGSNEPVQQTGHERVISRINASALKSAGVRVREPVMNMEESRATGVAAAVSHVRDRRLGKLAAPPSAWAGSIEPEDPSQVSPLRKSSEPVKRFL